MPARAPGPAPAWILVAVILAAGCATPEASPTWESLEARIASTFPNVPHISTDELARRLDDERAVLLVDTRAAEEYAVSHLEGAVHAPTPDAARALLTDLAPGTLVVAYCSVGYRSAALVEALAPDTDLEVVNLAGSIFAWANEQRPVVRGGTRADTVHPYDDRWGQLLDRRLWPGDWP